MKDLVEKFGQTGGEAIRDHKLSDQKLGDTEIRNHPSAPKSEARLF